MIIWLIQDGISWSNIVYYIYYADMEKVVISTIQDRGKFCRLRKIWIRISNSYCRKALTRANKHPNKKKKCTKTIKWVFDPSAMCNGLFFCPILPQIIAEILLNTLLDCGSIAYFPMSAPHHYSTGQCDLEHYHYWSLKQNLKKCNLH